MFPGSRGNLSVIGRAVVEARGPRLAGLELIKALGRWSSEEENSSPCALPKRNQVTDVAADNRLDDKETLGDFGAGKSLRCQELVKRITGGSQGCDDCKMEEGQANCSIGVDQCF